MDTTTNAIARLIDEARDVHRIVGYGTLLPALADTLEAVTQERDEKQAVYEITYRQLKVEEAMYDEQEAKIEAVTKERDALQEALRRVSELASRATDAR